MQNPAERIASIETAMLGNDFWQSPQKAQVIINELQELKDSAEGKIIYLVIPEQPAQSKGFR